MTTSTQRLLAIAFVSLLASCGGGGGSISTPTSTTPKTPVSTYTVSTSASEGVSFSSTSMTVENGKTASFTVTLLPGYTNAQFEGCGAKMVLNASGSTAFVTTAISSNCTVTGTATKAATTHKVSFISTGGVLSNFEGTQSLNGKTIDVKSGASFEFFLSPDEGYQVHNGTEASNCIRARVGTSTIRITPTSDCTFDYKFALRDVNFNSVPDKGEANFIISTFEVNPKAMRESDIGKINVTYTVAATGNQAKRSDGTVVPISKIVMRTRFKGVGVPRGTLEEEIRLYDDGANGDVKAGDMIYTASVRPTGIEDRFGTNLRGQMRTLPASVVLYDVQGNELRSFDPNFSNHELTTLLLKNSVAPAAPAVKVADNIYRSRNFITIVDPAYYRRDDEQWLTRTAAKYVSGTFDAVAVFNYGAAYGMNWATFGRVKQYASGIGIKESYDLSANYGLPGICGIINFGSAVMSGYAFNHELGHCWSANLRDTQLPLALNSSHWTMASEPLSLMGHTGLSITGGSGNWKLVASSTYDVFSWLDLYLAGMADVNEVPAMHYVNDHAFVAANTIGASVPDSKVSYMTSSDLVRVYGVRSPAYDGKVKNLRLLTIVVANKPLTEAEQAVMELVLANYASTNPGKYDAGDVTAPGFALACRNRCTLNTDIGAPTVQSAQKQALLMAAPVNRAHPTIIHDHGTIR